MAYRMNDQQAREVLAAGTHTGKLATVRADGSPHVAPVWFVLDGDDLVFTTGAGTSKGKALRRDPRAALVVDFEEPPYAFVLVEGRVSISENLAELLPLSIRIAERYVAPELAQQFGERNAVAGVLRGVRQPGDRPASGAMGRCAARRGSTVPARPTFTLRKPHQRTRLDGPHQPRRRRAADVHLPVAATVDHSPYRRRSHTYV
jgi:PPOX class probable F420-dependent enzyme